MAGDGLNPPQIGSVKKRWGPLDKAEGEIEAVVGDVHTNTIEGSWRLVERGIGVYIAVLESHYPQCYLDGFSFHYNHRFDTQPMFQTFMLQIEKRDVIVRCCPTEVEPF